MKCWLNKLLLILLVFCCLTLSGCWDRIEINDLAIVSGAAIDLGNKKNEITLSVQILSPRALSGSQGGSSYSTKMAIVRSAQGINIADAMSKLQKKLSRKIFLGHCKVYIFGERLAKAGISDMTDFISRHPETRNRAQIYVSKGDASSILQVIPPLERYSSEVLRELAKQNVGESVTLVDLRQMMQGQVHTCLLPMVAILPPQGQVKKEETIPYLVGTAVFDQGKMVGSLSGRITRGVMWLRDEIQRSTVTVKLKNAKGFITVSPIREHSRLEPRIENGKWIMKVQVVSEGDIVENGTNLNLSDPKWVAEIEEALRKDIETRIQLALDTLQKRMKVDIIEFGPTFYQKYPQQFNQVKDRWQEQFAEIEVALEVNTIVRRAGLAAGPAGIPQSNVKE